MQHSPNVARVRSLPEAVLCGVRGIWQGTVLALPAGGDLNVVNDPDPRRDSYQSLILDITSDMVAEQEGAGRAAQSVGHASLAPSART